MLKPYATQREANSSVVLIQTSGNQLAQCTGWTLQSIATGITFIVENMGTLPKDEHGGGPVPRIVESPVYTSLLLDIIPRSQYLRTGENYQNPEGPGRFVGRGRSYSSKLESEIGGFSLQTSGGGERWKGRIQKKIFGGKFQSHLSGSIVTMMCLTDNISRIYNRSGGKETENKDYGHSSIGKGTAAEARSSTPQEGSCRGSQIFHSTRRKLQRKPDLPLHKKEAAEEARSSTPQEGSCRGGQIFHSTRRKLQRKPDLPLHKKEAAEEARSSTPQEGSCRGSQIFHSTRRELQRKPDLPLHKKEAAEEARSSTPQEGSCSGSQIFHSTRRKLQRKPDLPLHKKEAAEEARSSTPQEGSCRGSQIFHSTRRELQRKPDLPLHKKGAMKSSNFQRCLNY
ncbi:hypothetical protein BLNAU_8565 [Blattamonas nauphoetae]|uniref:Uncharacterized protein n=1 Tax=Blattamonas nauphoetae TaxID=2049346 RepID=A0ABQ9XYH5_9EUKA|nr:hypothetical protein BLNAU_8565 [Blattamonas nauphoetae]